ncbi:hypothetical protein AB6A40_009102 [Gnathostoma spinigerum]|uniref:Protein kinase domain-containing protein n=1 Tax=Gnathostoma spinigerum TaxID=75299 RepID=A0ABD6EZ74_9BILA
MVKVMSKDIQIVGVIGHGYLECSEIYLAKRKGGKGLCSVRVLSVENVDYESIEKEIRFLKWLSHPNILSSDLIFVEDVNIFFVSPFYNLCSVLHIMQKYYPYGLPEKAIVRITKGLLLALQYLHEQKITHRAVRCGHVLLSSNNEVKLCGLRHCVYVNPNELTGVSECCHDFDESMINNLLWLAPEVLKQDLHGYGLLSDVYSLGITLCEMANGFPPFSDMDRLQMLYEKCKGTTPRLLDCTTLPDSCDDPVIEQKKRRFTDAFHNFVDICLKPSPDGRWPVHRLLSHHFVRSLKKSRSFTHLLPLAVPITEKNVEPYVAEPPADHDRMDDWVF